MNAPTSNAPTSNDPDSGNDPTANDPSANGPSEGPAPDSPFNTSSSESFQGPQPGGDNPFGGADPFQAGAGGNDPFANDPFGGQAPPSSVADDWRTMAIPASIAVDVARDWVRERQTATMLGAFAVGVFVGVLSR